MRYVVTGVSGAGARNIIWDSDICSVVSYKSDAELYRYVKEHGRLGNAFVEYGLVVKQDLTNDLVYGYSGENIIDIGGNRLTYFKDYYFVLEYKNDIYILMLQSGIGKYYHLPIVFNGYFGMYKDFIALCEFVKVPISMTKLRKCYILREYTYVRELCVKYCRCNENVRSRFEV